MLACIVPRKPQVSAVCSSWDKKTHGVNTTTSKIHTCRYTYVCVCVCVRVRAYVRSFVRACVCAHACVRVRACAR